jgi:hypothetical protein
MWYELCSAMYICGFLKLFDYLNRLGIIFNIRFAVYLIHMDQFIILQVLQDLQNLFLGKSVGLGVIYNFRLCRGFRKTY